MDWLTIGYGALGGLGWSLLRLGYYKANVDEKKRPEVQYKRILKTVIIGAVVGAFAAYQGQEVSADVLEALSQTAFISGSVTAVVDTVVNFVIRLLKRVV